MSRSSSFELLHETVRRWVWRQGWTSLKEIQENSIPAVLKRDSDVIISASTAGGKTEAAFMPILSNILSSSGPGYDVLYISPLKALINDQYRRLADMTQGTGINVTPWHGDIDASRKARSMKAPSGIVIITPESLESFLINRAQMVKTALGGLKYIVIDELHAFIGNERGKQLQSLLSRIEAITSNKAPRIAMSATFSDYESVKEFLRQDRSLPCVVPPQGDSNHEIKILVKEYIPTKDENCDKEIAQEIFSRLRGSNNLAFTNTRVAAENYAVMLADISEEMNVPNEFRVHHGNLSRQERESVEQELQKGSTPVTALCTSTLELGVDIGKVKSIAQIGTANSISGLRQRLGRSGRREEPSILRVFSVEHPQDTGIMHDMRANLIQNIAVIELLRQKEYERPVTDKLHLSTLVQQILSLIASYSGFYPKEGWEILCKRGAFRNIQPQVFLSLLKTLGQKEVLSQLATGQIIIGKEGERLLRKPDFYTAFVCGVDYTVINKADSKRIGVLEHLPPVGDLLILAGKRWIVTEVDKKKCTVMVSRVDSGGEIRFSSDPAEIDRIITRKMRDIYMKDTVFPYVDAASGSRDQLANARKFFKDNEIGTRPLLQYGADLILFTWAGAKINRTIALACRLLLNKDVGYDYISLYGMDAADVKSLATSSKPQAEALAGLVDRELKIRQKYDHLLSEELLNIEYAGAYLDVDGAWDELNNIINNNMGLFDFLFGDRKEEAPKTVRKQAEYPLAGMSDWQIKNYFKDILITNFPEYELKESIPVTEIFGDANDSFQLYKTRPYQAYKAEWGEPYTFVMYREGVIKGVVMIGDERSHHQRVKYLISRMYAKKGGLPYINFYTNMPNQTEYVAERVRKFLEA